MGRDLGDENILGSEGLVVQVRTDPSGPLGCVRGVRAFCDSGWDGVGPGVLPVRNAMR